MRTPLETLPLLQIRAVPRTEPDTCLFRERHRAGKVKLVFYHFEREATIEEPAPEMSV